MGKVDPTGQFWTRRCLNFIPAVGSISASSSYLPLVIEKKPRSLLAPKVTRSGHGFVVELTGVTWFIVPGVVVTNIVFSGAYYFWLLTLKKDPKNQDDCRFIVGINCIEADCWDTSARMKNNLP